MSPGLSVSVSTFSRPQPQHNCTMETHTINNKKKRSTAPNFLPPSLERKSEFLKPLCGQADGPASKQTGLQTFTTSLVHPVSALALRPVSCARSVESSRHPTGPLRRSVLPAVACKSSRERKQQIKTVPFMMAARRTLIVTQTIYTVAGRSKGTQGRGGGPAALGQLVEGWGAGPARWRCCRSHGMPGGRYEHEQLPFIFREAAAPALTSALVTLPQGFRTGSLVLSAVISRSHIMQNLLWLCQENISVKQTLLLNCTVEEIGPLWHHKGHFYLS